MPSSTARLILLFVAAAMVAQAAHGFTTDDDNMFMGTTGNNEDDRQGQLVSNALDMEEMMMDSELARRQLAAARTGSFVSYSALERNSVPCNHQGQSYYNCRESQKANPYEHSCTRVTKCARNAH